MSLKQHSRIQLQVIQNRFFDTRQLTLTELIVNPESQEYAACSFLLNDKKIIYRQAKITPTKTGQFVTIWKRNATGLTEPYSSNDAFDFFIITVQNNELLGQFIFPKEVLFTKGIITHKNKVGKRGIRLYAPWDEVTSKQASITKSWQCQYFYALHADNTETIDRMTSLF